MDLSRAVWRKSARSEPNGQCVEVADHLPGAIAIRDSKDPTGSMLVIEPAGWAAFLVAVKAGEFDN